jgi:hypothetical protein
VNELLDRFRANLAADPPIPSKPFRRVVIGEPGIADYPRPFLAIELARARVIGACDGDKLLEIAASLRVITDILEADAHTALLDRVAAVDDYLDSLIDTGSIEGAEGFDDRVWTFDEPRAGGGARVATAAAAQTFVVKVARGQNRVPA